MGKENATKEVSNQTEPLETYDDIILQTVTRDTSPAKGVIIFVHDYQLNLATRNSLLDQLCLAAYHVVGYDLRGHGSSQGEAGAIRSFDDLLEDLDLFWARIKGRYTNLPIFIIGEGLGSVIATLFCASRKVQLSGLILVKPFFDIKPAGSTTWLPILTTLMPKKKISCTIGSKQTNQWHISYQTLRAIGDGIGRLKKITDEISAPILLIRDSEISEEESGQIQQFFYNLISFDKKQEIPNASFYLDGDKPSDEFMRLLIEWISERLSLNFISGDRDEEDEEL